MSTRADRAAVEKAKADKKAAEDAAAATTATAAAWPIGGSFSNSGFAAALKPSPFTGTYFKRW